MTPAQALWEQLADELESVDEVMVRVNGVAPEHTYRSVRAALSAYEARSTAHGGTTPAESTAVNDEGNDPA